MHELFDQLTLHARGIWRFRWYAMVIAWLVCILGWAFVLRMPDVYEASARVYVDTKSVLQPLLRGLALPTDSRQEIELMTKTLLSRPNLEKLARMTDLDLKAKTPEEMESLLDSLARKISFGSTKRENLYTIAYVHSDRELAKRVVQSLLTIFVETALGESRADTDVAQRFLDAQIKEYEARLVAAEERLAEFKRKNVGLMPNSGEDFYGRLQAALAEMEQAKLQLRETRNRRSAIARQLKDLADEAADYSSFGSGLMMGTPLEGRINDLQSMLDEMLLKYTEQHPDVIEIRRTLSQLEAQLEEEAALMAESDFGQQSEHPMYQQMSMVLAETDAQIASMEVRVQEYEDRVEHLKQMVDTIPKVEAELTRLNRDYDVNKRNYETLLARREAAKISEQATMSSDDIKFRVVDPPRVPLSPSGPDRPLLFSGVLGGALLLGMAFAFVLYQARPTFDDPKVMRDITGIPVLGAVSMVRTDEYLTKRRFALAAFSFAILVLLASYGGVVATELFDVNLMASLTKLAGQG